MPRPTSGKRGYYGTLVKLEESLSCQWALWLGVSYFTELVNGLPSEAFRQGWQELLCSLPFLVEWSVLSELGVLIRHCGPQCCAECSGLAK